MRAEAWPTSRESDGAPEAPETGAAARLPGLAGDARGLAQLSRDMVLRAPAAASDDVSGRILAEVARSGPVGLDALAGRVGLPALPVGERVGALAQLGLVTRDLERDSAGATAAGRGLVDLVEVLATALGERVQAGLPALLVP